MKILVAVDGTQPSNDAATLIGRIADPGRSEITVMSVAPPPDQPLPDLWMLVREDETEARVTEIVRAAQDRLRDSGHESSVQIERGRAVEQLLKTIGQDHYQMVVMGSGMHSWLGQHLLGSISNAILHSSPVSVMIVHRLLDHPGDRLNIALGTDGSADAKQAAATLARFSHPERVRFDVISVAPHLVSGFYTVPAAPTVAFDEAAHQEAVSRATETSSAAADFLALQGYEVQSRAVTGGVAPMLLKEAESLQSDLVVLGNRGLGALGRVLLGSTSDNVARHALATLVVK